MLRISRFALLLASIAVAGVQTVWLLPTPAAAQPSQAQTRSLPVFEVDPSWPKVPPQFRLGDASSIGIDAQDNVWILHRPRTLKPDQVDKAAKPIVIFDAGGNFVRAWGGAGSGYDGPEREHGIHIDHKGFIWVGGNNCADGALLGLRPVADDALLKFAPDGKFVMQIGRSDQSKGNTDTNNVHRAADAWVHAPTNEVFVADGYGNTRVVVFDADSGAFKRMWGAFGNKPTGADSCKVISPKTFPDAEGPPNFNVVHALRVSKDGMVYVADRENRRVQMFSADGKFVKQLIRTAAPFARDLAFSADPGQQFLYVGAEKDIAVVDRKTLEVVGAIQVPGILGAGHHIATDSKGNLYIAQTARGLQKLVFKGMSAAPDR